MRAILLALSFMLAASTFAAAEREAAEGIEDGVRLFHEGDFEESSRALSAIASRLPPGVDRARARLFIGLSRSVLGDWVGAREAFRQALTDDPLVAPDRDRVRPGIVDAFEEVHRTVTGTLEIEADRESSVYLDDRPVGRTPFSGDLPVGRYLVRVLSTDGLFELGPIAVVVEAGGRKRIEAKLESRMGRLTLDSTPVGARVVEGDRPIATTPIAELAMPAGPHQIKIELEGWRTSELRVLIAPDELSTLEVELVRQIDRPWFAQRSTYAIGAIGLSVALAGAGAIFGVSASAAESDLSTRAREGTLDFDRQIALQDRASNQALAANVFYGSAAIAAITGVVLFLIGEAPEEAKEP